MLILNASKSGSIGRFLSIEELKEEVKDIEKELRAARPLPEEILKCTDFI